MHGLEARIIGGTFLQKYSCPEAFAEAASMAFDEAMLGASPVVIERWSGVTLKVAPDAIKETLETLIRLLGEVPALISLKQDFVIRAQAPVSLLAEFGRIFNLLRLETYPLPREQQYRAVTRIPPKPLPYNSALDDWT
jgi:translation elongation factor EF-G